MGEGGEEERLKSDGRATDGDNYIIFRIPTGRKSLLMSSPFPSQLCCFYAARGEHRAKPSGYLEAREMSRWAVTMTVSPTSSRSGSLPPWPPAVSGLSHQSSHSAETRQKRGPLCCELEVLDMV